jgi:hypothetical protein
VAQLMAEQPPRRERARIVAASGDQLLHSSPVREATGALAEPFDCGRTRAAERGRPGSRVVPCGFGDRSTLEIVELIADARAHDASGDHARGLKGEP